MVGVENLSLKASYRYREGKLDSVSYSKISVGGSAVSASQLQSINQGVTYSGEIDVHTIGAGAEYQFNLDESGKIRPYVSGGLDYAFVDTDNLTVSAAGQTNAYNGDDAALGLTMGTGVNMEISDNMAGTLGYVYRRHGDYSIKGKGAVSLKSEDYSSHAIMAGVVINF